MFNFFQASLSLYKQVIMLWILLPIFILSGCSGVYSQKLWSSGPHYTIDVIVPDEYEGPVFIAWEIPDGKRTQENDGILTYAIDDDGSLLLGDDLPTGVGQWRFWYKKPTGTLLSIPHSLCFDDSSEEGIVVCTTMQTDIYNARKLFPNSSFVITKITDKRNTVNEIDTLIDKYFDRLIIPKEISSESNKDSP